MKRHGFPKSAHLLRPADFRKVYDEGRRRNLDWLVVFSLTTGDRPSRVGFTVPAAFGPAVDRNRVKRVLREAVRKSLAELGSGWDIVMNPRRKTLDLDTAAIERAIGELFQGFARRAHRGGSHADEPRSEASRK
jgi:ribonuclease P protein component